MNKNHRDLAYCGDLFVFQLVFLLKRRQAVLKSECNSSNKY